ncbi:MAG: phospholipid carrier-dependent glycosyltransferase [Solirubrobacteraceae bacterium]
MLLALLLVGGCVRVLAMVSYPPALFFGDSWGYVVTAFSGHTLGIVPVALSNDRPSGYPVLLWLLSSPGRDLVSLIAVQHFAGLLTGSLVYIALTRAGAARVAGACAAALVLLDGYAITLEQYVMADAFFALTVLLAGLALAWPALSSRSAPEPRIAAGRAAAAGLLLAVAVLQRLEGMFVIPVFVGYLLWMRVGWRVLAAYAVAVLLPLLAYANGEYAKFGTFGLTQESGWTLYGRVAGFADCAGAGVAPVAKRLCETAAQRASHPDASTWYIFDASSPAVRMFGGQSRSVATQRFSDGVLRAFAIRIVLHQPLDYLAAVGGDFLRFFTPGATAFDDSTSATALPVTAGAEYIDQYVRSRFLPSLRPRVRQPAAFVRGYRATIHLPRPLLALLALASLLATALRAPARKEVLLLSGSGLALLLGTAATAGFGLRYLLCAVPLLAIGGTLALRDTWAYARRRTRPQAGGARHAQSLVKFPH